MTEHPLPVSSTPPALEKLVSRLLAEFRDQYGLDLAEDPVALHRVREAAEKALGDLRQRENVEIFLPSISANPAGPIHLRRMVSRDELVSEGSSASPASPSLQGQEVPQRVQVPLPDGKPLVTFTLLAVMAVIYILQLVTGFLFYQDLPAAWGMKINQAILAGEYWRLITPMFLHGSIFHLGFNLYALYILGRRIERFFDSKRFILLFLIAGITGNLFSFIFTPAPSLGSSTAIFGLLAAEGVFIYQHRKMIGDRSQSALRQIIQVAVINFLIGLSPGIDNWGHLGGLVGGALFTWFAGPAFRLEGTPPRLRFTDQRSDQRALVVFLALLFMLICLTAGVVLLRG